MSVIETTRIKTETIPTTPCEVLILERMEMLIRKGWTRGTEARAKDYQLNVSYKDRRAVRWCLVGALKRALHDEGIQYPCYSNPLYRAVYNRIQDVLPRVYCECGCGSLIGHLSPEAFNDDAKSKRDVIRMIAKAKRAR